MALAILMMMEAKLECVGMTTPFNAVFSIWE